MGSTEKGRRAQAIGQLAAVQRGLVTAAQLEEAGMSRNARYEAAGSGHLMVVRRGVYRLVGAPRGWETEVLAAVLAAGARAHAVASHTTAARLWRLIAPRSRWWTDAIDITSSHRVRLESARTHHRDLGVLEQDHCRAVPVTSVTRTLLDLADGVVPRPVLGTLVDEALRRGMITLGGLSRTVEDHRRAGGAGARGTLLMRAVLDERGEGFDPGANPWEAAMDRMWERVGLPTAERQYWIGTSHGRYRPDRVIVPERIAVDWNGYDHHGRRSRFDFDSDRRGHMIEAGWLPLDFTSRSTPEHICRTVLSAVAQRRRR